MADGNALAIARDVTIFQAPSPQGLPLSHAQNSAPENMMASHQAQTSTEQTANYANASAIAAPQHAVAEAEIAEPAPSFEPNMAVDPSLAPPAMAQIAAPVEAAPIPNIMPDNASVAAPVATPLVASAAVAATAAAFSPQDAAQDALQDTPQDTMASSAPHFEMEAAPQHADMAPMAPAEHQAEHLSAPLVEAPTQERDFERRALPIEDGDTVLGSNWRDAVIARAVGADAEEEVQPAPVSLRVEDNEAQTDEPSNSSQGLRILLAEDNAINALLTRTLLEAEGCIVETVEDGALAVQAMQDNMYDLIFMDMRMPNMDGLEATRKIRAMGSRTADLPIIALTANAFDDDRNACFDSGMNDFMTKPVSAEELTQMVSTWTKKQNEADVAA